MDTTGAGLDQETGRFLDYAQAGPTAARMRLGVQLRRLRETAHIAREDAATVIRASAPKISRLELGRTSVKLRDLTGLLGLYGVHDEAARATLLALARHANAPGWWKPYGEVVPAWFELYLGLEQAASIIRTYEVQFVPGLLQTADYARAVFGLSGDAHGEQADRRVTVRIRRQQILGRDSPPHLWAVIDETALRRPVGGRAVMRAQLEHLVEMTRLPHVNIQVLPLRAGSHPVAGGPVTLLRFPGEQLPDVVYLEQLVSAVYPAKPADLARYWNLLNQLATEADPPIASTMIFDQIRKEL